MKAIYLLHAHAHAFETAPSRCYCLTVAVKKKRAVLTQLKTLFQQPLSGNSERENAITKSIGVFIAADLRPFSVVDKQAVFFNFPTVPILPYRDFKTKVRTKP